MNRMQSGTARFRASVFVLLCLCLLMTPHATAHPGSGIVVDQQGNIYFVYTGRGVMRIDPSGQVTLIHNDPAGHWLALDQLGSFANATPKEFQRITPDGVVPALIFASGGAPIIVANDGNLYYGATGEPEPSFAPGATAMARLSPTGRQEIFAPTLRQKLGSLKDGVTGLASGPDGSIYVATWNGVIKLVSDGAIANIIYPIALPGCDHDPADHLPANASSPLLRGLAVDPRTKAVYVTATSCHTVLKISADGQVSAFVKVTRPWSPTGVAVHDGKIYVLEYTNANGPKTEGWSARVRRFTADGKGTTIVTLPPVASIRAK